jgi:hypothetical protein
MYKELISELTSRINPGTIIRIKVFSVNHGGSGIGRKWLYAIHLRGSLFYIAEEERIKNLSAHTLVRAHIDNRLEIIEHE